MPRTYDGYDLIFVRLSSVPRCGGGGGDRDESANHRRQRRPITTARSVRWARPDPVGEIGAGPARVCPAVSLLPDAVAVSSSVSCFLRSVSSTSWTADNPRFFFFFCAPTSVVKSKFYASDYSWKRSQNPIHSCRSFVGSAPREFDRRRFVWVSCRAYLIFNGHF